MYLYMHCPKLKVALSGQEEVLRDVTNYFYTYHTQTIIGTASFPYLDPFTKALYLILYNYILDLPYHCTI